jgi:FixJ family two-component response regulator
VIAVVDDDPSVRRSVVNLLESLGLQAAAFASAELFLASDVAQTECLVLDVRLPEMSGLELLERLRSTEVELAVVILTAHGDEETRKRAEALGAVAFLTKPFRAEELGRAVKAGATGTGA